MDASVSRRPATTTLPRRADFLRVAATRRRCVTPGLILQVAPLPDAQRAQMGLRVGYTASKRVGNAVARNLSKRRLREAVRKIMPLHAREGMDYVLIAREETAARPFDQLLADLRQALQRLGVERISVQR
ncbi:MAG: rnpA [Alphaproteobacteria bacterium]|jgi:ribonuclease P protein component|nr:rnpA [Alphaproteobacteria bacterium]